MNKSFPLDSFIHIINEKIPEGTKIVDYTAECLSLGKDACYRRLRGEVEFSISEVVQLASSLSISIDDLIKINEKKSFVVETQFMLGANIINDYENVLKRTINHLTEIKTLGKTTIFQVCDSLPMTVMGKYRLLQKLKFYKWHYNNLPDSEKLADFEVPQSTYDLLDKLFDAVSCFKTVYVLDKHLLAGIVHHVVFFHSLGKINKEEVSEIKKELQRFISRLKNQATLGYNDKGEPVTIYCSHILIETSSVLVDNEYNPKVAYNIFSANSIVASDIKFCATYRNWVSSMKKSSRLISETGDIDRARFFNSLEEDLEKLPS